MNRFPVRKKIRLPLEDYAQNHAFFITVTTHQKYPWFRLHPHLCDAATRLIRDLSQKHRKKIYAGCIMPDHIHLLAEGSEIINFIRLFKGKMTPSARVIAPERRLWHRSFYDHAIRSAESLNDIACYIWENPVRAMLVDEPASYPWSGSEVWPAWRSHYSSG